ncbi:hypothetical protein F7725_013972 [Dissostichus mawsoni]|uniref:Uncharacterized protein n=1 Tax=Dissostichus mawsoni TaxID=36200 RepID=A0A7J5YUM0_DISMA|nr:hypothetical protein F7725_013972 [Dissostichus mawsoni]
MREFRVLLSVCRRVTGEHDGADRESATGDRGGGLGSGPTKTIKNKLELYFGSKKKSSGGDCRVEAEEEAPRAAVYFQCQEVRERVIARKNHEIIVGNQTFKLHLLADLKTPEASAEKQEDKKTDTEKEKEKSVQSGAVVLDNVSDRLSRDLLSMLVENISGLDESCYSLEIIWESSRAVITFNKPPDVEKFLTGSQCSQKLQKHGLTARPLEAAESVRVENLPPTVIKEMLELFFERSWTLPDNVVMIPDEYAAIATFNNAKVVESICHEQDYAMLSITFKVYPYYESMGTALYGKERPTWKMPEPFRESVHNVVWRFLREKKLFQSINDQMSSYFCSVNLDNPDVILSPLPSLLRQKGLTAKHVDTWMSTAQQAFRQQMSQYSAFECKVNASAWKAAEEEVRSIVKEEAALVHDASRGILTVAGRADDIKKVKGPVENIVLKAISQIKRQTEGVSECMDMSPAKFYILNQEGLLKAAQDISPDMKISLDEGAQKLTITGLPAEVYKTKSWILERTVGTSKKQLNVPPSLLDYFNTVDDVDMSQGLFTSHDEKTDTEKEKEKSVQSGAVVLDNVSDRLSRDLLSMLVENISGLDESCYSLEIIWESSRAVITFNKPPDVEKFLTGSQCSQKLQKHGLTARPLEAAESVRVENLPPTVIKEMLELFFERSWALPDSVVMIPDEHAAIATFNNAKVVESICHEQDYAMLSITFKVYPYYESMGTALYGKERPTWKMPEPFRESVHNVVWRFLREKKLFQSINDQMSSYFCSVNLDNPDPLPSLLRQKGLTAKHVDTWMSTAQQAFRQQMSQYSAFECKVNASAWKAAEEEVRSIVKEDAALKVKGPVENIVLKAISQIKRQTEGVSECMDMSPAKFYILNQEGLLKAAQDISPDMKISLDEGAQKLTITGLPAEVYKTKSWILERTVGTSKKQLNVPPSLLDYFNTVDDVDMSQGLFTSHGFMTTMKKPIQRRRRRSPFRARAVVLDNVSDRLSRDLLSMLVENISGLDESCYSLEIIWESSRAKFLTGSQCSQKLQRHGLTARPLEAAESVRVENLPPTVIKVVESICHEQDYAMRSITFKVYPYYESMGTALYGKERPTWKMPEPFRESVHNVVWRFLREKKLFQSINDQMSSYFCSVNLDNPDVILSPLPSLLRQKGLTAKHVDTWMSTAQQAFRQQMSQYSAFECKVNASAWKAAEEEVRSIVKEDAALVHDASRGILTVAGRADDIKKVKGPVENIVLKAISQIKTADRRCI